MGKRIIQIRDILERLYARYNRRRFINTDPLQFVYQYSGRADMEIVGFLAAELAYGRVQQIEKSLVDLLGRMGDSPFKFVQNFDRQKRAKLKDFKHRFTTGDDISDLLMLLKKVLNQYGSIEKFFLRGYNPNDKNIISALSKFCDSLLDMYTKAHNCSVRRGLSYLLPRPAAGSACKRLNLFLRWMVRNDGVDAGLWNTIDKAKLIVPVDVHIGRLCRILGLYPVRSNPAKSERPLSVQTSNGVYDRNTVSLRAAVKITESFAEIEPADPVKYDFSLSRIGIVDNCTGRLRSGCESCELFGFCCSR